MLNYLVDVKITPKNDNKLPDNFIKLYTKHVLPTVSEHAVSLTEEKHKIKLEKAKLEPRFICQRGVSHLNKKQINNWINYRKRKLKEQKFISIRVSRDNEKKTKKVLIEAWKIKLDNYGKIRWQD